VPTTQLLTHEVELLRKSGALTSDSFESGPTLLRRLGAGRVNVLTSGPNSLVDDGVLAEPRVVD